MELRYTFDKERFYLGTLCKRGHAWPGTQQSLRSTYKDKRGRTVNPCVGCKGAKTRDWLLSWIDHEAMGITDGRRLGILCSEKHDYNGLGLTLRSRHGRCIECERIRSAQRRQDPAEKERSRLRYLANLEDNRANARERMRRLLSTEEGRERARRSTLESVKRRRAIRGRESRAKGLESLLVPLGQRLSSLEARIARELVANGHPLDFWTLKPLIDQRYQLECALKDVGRSPSVARLVMDEQRRYWRKHPEAKREHDNQWARARWWLEYQINPDRRLYVRQKSKRRKALLREQTAHQISPKQLQARFAQFGNCCAYCGASGDMQIEHVVPISRGGTHAMGNIVPACKSCNYSKREHEVERWYRAQPHFCEKRWRKICRVLGWDRSGVGQLAML